MKPETDTPIFSLSLLERSDFDFVEELWVRLRKSEFFVVVVFMYYHTLESDSDCNLCMFLFTGVASYQDITDSLKLVIGTLSNGQIKPWVCWTLEIINPK